MDTIGIRELQQNASKAIERVTKGATLGVTARGKLVAVLSPPPAASGIARAAAEGRLRPARGSLTDLPAPRRKPRVPSAETLAELRGDT
jgi:antitoxin (DNA-binding transcriptional repressor) of toxin-antitoxin stability system